MFNQNTKFAYKGMKTTYVTLQITQSRNHLNISNEKMSKFKTPKSEENVCEMCI